MPSDPPPPPSVNFSGPWRNHLGSGMELTVSGSQVTGVYRTNVGSPRPSEEFPLTGFVTGDLIGFVVNFGKYGSITAWAGQHTERAPGVVEIRSMWHLARNVPDQDEPQELWAGVLSGCNVFFR